MITANFKNRKTGASFPIIQVNFKLYGHQKAAIIPFYENKFTNPANKPVRQLINQMIFFATVPGQAFTHTGISATFWGTYSLHWEYQFRSCGRNSFHWDYSNQIGGQIPLHRNICHKPGLKIPDIFTICFKPVAKSDRLIMKKQIKSFHIY
jgi:hypothetical protein